MKHYIINTRRTSFISNLLPMAYISYIFLDPLHSTTWHDMTWHDTVIPHLLGQARSWTTTWHSDNQWHSIYSTILSSPPAPPPPTVLGGFLSFLQGQLVEALLDGRIVVHGPIESCKGDSLRFRHSKGESPWRYYVVTVLTDQSVSSNVKNRPIHEFEGKK